MSSSKFTNNSDIRLGFEVECVIEDAYKVYPSSSYTFTNRGFERISKNPTTKWKEFQAEIKGLTPAVIIGQDGSINCVDSDRGVELKTPPLSPRNAMILLEKVFNIVNKYGFTNSSCGFHVNISSAHKSKMKKFNPIPFLSSKLWSEILNEFSRGGNEFCRPLITKGKNLTNIQNVNNLLDRGRQKYRCVNLRNFGTGTGKRSRVEVRGFGNRDYSKKFETISGYIKRIEKLFKLSCGSFSELKTPKV